MFHKFDGAMLLQPLSVDILLPLHGRYVAVQVCTSAQLSVVPFSSSFHNDVWDASKTPLLFAQLFIVKA